MSMTNDKLLGRLEAHLEELHADVRDIQKEVATLKDDLIRRKSIANILYWVMGLATTAITAYLSKHF